MATIMKLKLLLVFLAILLLAEARIGCDPVRHLEEGESTIVDDLEIEIFPNGFKSIKKSTKKTTKGCKCCDRCPSPSPATVNPTPFPSFVFTLSPTRFPKTPPPTAQIITEEPTIC